MAEKEYIEREKLKQAFSTDTQSIRGWDVDLFDLLMIEIDEAPTADVEPIRHGHFETISDSDMSKTVMCSVCNKMFYFTKKGQLNIDMMPYCPNCGAKMEGNTT